MNIDWVNELNDLKFDDMEYVCVHFEDCFSCDSYDKCPTAERMELYIPVFEFIIDMFEEEGVKVRKYRGTSQNNAKKFLKQPHHNSPLPLELTVFMKNEELKLIRLPHYNYFTIRYKDGSEELHTVRLKEDKPRMEFEEGTSCQMYM